MGKIEDKLIVYNYLHLPLAVLNDNTEDRARNIDLNPKINGVSKLTFDLPLHSEKWYYVTQDNLVIYKEQMYVIQIPNLNKTTTGGMVSVECQHIGGNLEGKLNVAFGKTELVGKTIREMMTVVLDGSGWTIGDVDVPDSTKRGLIVNEQSVMANVKKASELFDCAYIFDATLDYKKIHFKQSATENFMVIREGVNMRSLNVTIDKSSIITRLLVSGANDPITNRPITVYGATMKDELGNILYESDGTTPKIYDKTYIEDFSYYLDVGYEQSYIDSHPEYFLKESILNMSDYVDKTDLLFDSMKTLRASAKPKIEVSFDMADKIDNDNLFLHTPELNEMVYVYSKEINDKLNIKTTVGYNGNMFQMKVSEIKINSEKPDSCTVTARNYSQYDGLIQTLISNADTLNKLIQTDGTVPTNRLQGFIDILATKLNSVQSHWFTDESGNLIFEDDIGTSAMKLGGGIFGIANSKLPDGSWNWRTFGNGEGFTADMMNTGTLNADLVKAGTIRSFDDSVVIDLDTGYFNFKDKIVYDVNGMKIVGAVTFESLDKDLKVAQTYSNGKMLYTDGTFLLGSNGCYLYNNASNGAVTLTRIAKPSDAPTMSTHALNIKVTGLANPSLGGFHQQINSRAGAKFVVRIIAKLPIGYSFATASNSMGDGFTDKIITSNEGTGKYEEYIRVVTCGQTGAFSNGGHWYVNGATPSADYPLNWYIAYASAFDVTDIDETTGLVGSWRYSGTTTINGGAIQTDTITAIQIAANTITANEIASNTITANQIASNTITATQISANAITASEISSDAVTAVKIKAGEINSGHIVAGAIISDKIGANQITSSHIVAGNINAGHIASDAITASKIKAGEINAGHISATGITADKIKTGVMSSTTGSSSINLNNGTFNFGGGKLIYDGNNVTMIDLDGNILINTSKGIANEQNFGSTQNVEDGYPLNMSFKIGSTTTQIDYVEIRLKQYNFRTDSKGAAEDGARTSGASSSSTSGSSSKSTADNETPGSAGIFTEAPYGGVADSTHEHYIVPSKLTHGHGMAHTHTMYHTHSTPAHGHTVDFGILETTNYNGTIYVDIDGVYCTYTTNTDTALNITPWVSTSGTHTISLRSPNLKRIQADVFIKSYIKR